MNRTQTTFVVGAIAGAAASGLAVHLYLKRQHSLLTTPSVARSKPVAPALQAAVSASLQEFEHDEILAEQLTRNVQFFGIDRQKIIANSFVAVIGLGVSWQLGCASSSSC